MTVERCECGHLITLHVKGRADCAAWADTDWCDCQQFRESVG